MTKLKSYLHVLREDKGHFQKRIILLLLDTEICTRIAIENFHFKTAQRLSTVSFTNKLPYNIIAGETANKIKS